MKVLHIDFETRSTVDLPDTGVYVYAADPTTDVWCMAYAIDDEEPRLWLPGNGLSGDLEQALRDEWVGVVAHNANFEWVIWNLLIVPRYGWPKMPVERMRCTMAAAYAMSLPGALDNAGAALGLSVQKDPAGHRLMMQMARPRKIEDGKITWWDDADRRNRLYAYCLQDVRAEQALGKRLRPLSPSEQKVWELDQRINARGVMVDAPLCRKALEIVGATTQTLDVEMRRVTDKGVNSCMAVQQLLNWVKKQGIDCTSVSKDSIVDLLAEVELPKNVRRALELRQEAAKTSTAKIDTLLTGMSQDGRARGLLQYHAASTGRWGGRRFQPQNLPRPKLKPKDIATAIGMIARGDHQMIDMVYGAPLTVVSDCIRSLITAAPDRDLLAADFANIEGRVIAWWAGEKWKLDAFRAFDAKAGPDLYKVAAGGIFGVKPESIDDSDWKRQIGKVSELALGYQGGVGAFVKMATTYGVKIEQQCDIILNAAAPEHLAQAEENYAKATRRPAKNAFLPAEVVKLAWREVHPGIVSLWYKCEEAVISAVEEPGKVFSVSGVRWRVNGSFLWCALPSGRLLCYPYPKIELKETPWGAKKGQVHYKGVDSRTRKWGDLHTYGGKIVENVVQAIARDFMVDAMLRVEKAGYPIVLTVHDEIMAEPRCDFGSLEQFSELMKVVPSWGTGCPIAVAGWRGSRYRK